MEQLTNYRELIKTFENEIIDKLNNDENAANVINKFVPMMVEVEGQLKRAIIENKMSIRCKSDVSELIKMHQLFQNLLNDLISTSPNIKNYKIVEKLCRKSNFKLTLKINTCITNLFL